MRIQKNRDAPRCLLYDIETTPREVWVWGEYEQNVIRVKKESYILCFAYKWLGGKKTNTISLPDFSSYKKNKSNDKNLVRELHKVLSEADIVISHNGDRFDNKWANKQFVKYGLSPVTPYKSIDTLKIAKKYFRFDSNRLDSLARFLGIGAKVQHEGQDLWFNCMKGDKIYWKKMLKYVKHDVVLLEKVYMRLRPWIQGGNPISLEEETCPKCGSYRLQKRGFDVKASGMEYQRYQCNSCGGWSRSRKGQRFDNPLMGV